MCIQIPAALLTHELLHGMRCSLFERGSKAQQLLQFRIILSQAWSKTPGKILKSSMRCISTKVPSRFIKQSYVYSVRSVVQIAHTFFILDGAFPTCADLDNDKAISVARDRAELLSRALGIDRSGIDTNFLAKITIVFWRGCLRLLSARNSAR